MPRLRRPLAALAVIVALAVVATVPTAAAAEPPSPGGPALGTAAVAPSRYIPLFPARVFDTRPATLLNHAGGKPGRDAVTTIGLLGRVPTSATAVVLTLTAVDADDPGFVQLLPGGSGTLRASSNLNLERRGQTAATTVFVPITADGILRAYTEVGAHLVVDLIGYFVAAGGPTSGGRMIALTPTRVFDTRPTSPVGSTGTKPAPRSTTRVQVAGVGPVPADVSALVLQVTAVDATAGGFVQVGPGGAVPPFWWSNINLETAGQSMSNLVVVAPNSTGAIDIYSERGAHLLVDVAGYFTRSTAPAGTNGLLVPIDPTRALDTRRQSVPAPGSIIQVDTTTTGVPSGGASAVVANVGLLGASAPGYVQAGPADSLVVGASSVLNASRRGQTIAVAAVSPTSGERFSLFTEGGGHQIVDVLAYFTR